MTSRLTLWGRLRAIWRMCTLVALVAWFLCRLLIAVLFKGHSEARGFRIRRAYTRNAMQVLGVKLTLRGAPPTLPALYVSNHRSLLDPIIQLHYIDAYIVAKSEISGYPLFGRGARETGVVWVTRENKESRSATRDAIRQLLAEGKSVFIYPEGTTSNEVTTQEFKPGAFQVAAELSIPVIPIAIYYEDPNDNWHDQEMLPFFMRKFSKRRIESTLSFGQPVEGDDAETLMHNAREWIGEQILLAGRE